MARRNLDLDDLDCVSGGLNMRSLQNHLSDHDISPNPLGNGANPLNNALLGGPAVGSAVPAGMTPIDASQGQFFDPFGAPGQPAAVAGAQYGAFPSAVPHFPGVQAPGPQAQGPNYLNAIPGVIGALGQVGSNPLGAIGGVLGALGSAQGQGSPLGAIGGILGSLGRGASGGNPLGALGGLLGGGTQGGNPLGALGGLFGGGGQDGAPQGGAPQGGAPQGGAPQGGGNFGDGDFGGF